MTLLTIIYIIFFIIVLISLFMEYRKQKMITAYIFCKVSFLLYFIIIPIAIFIILSSENSIETGFFKYLNPTEIENYWYALFFSIIFYVCLEIFYKLLLGNNLKITPVPKNTLQFSKIIDKYAFKIGVGTFFIGLISEVVIIRDLGGITNALSKAESLRAFNGNGALLIPQNHLFLTITMVLTLASTYLIGISNRIKPSTLKKVFFLLSFITSTFYLLFNAGRLGILLFFLCFLLDFAFRNLKHPFLFVIAASIVSLALLDKLDDLFFYLSYGYIKKSEYSNVFISMVNEFMFPYTNLLHSLRMNDYFGLRYGLDFVTWIINLVPYSILSIFNLSKVTTSYDFITTYYLGQGSLGGVPTDILTQGIRQFATLGIVIISFLIAILCRMIDNVLSKDFFYKYTFFSLRITSVLFVIIPYADLDSFVKNRMDLVLLFIFILICNKSYKKHFLKNETIKS
ncbi:hypothetical protein ACQUEV_02315 [Enterococcus gallinarum]|uniref:hypothetical protein n=1 Tax=Enterococcus gallinarum TaxID=1353 RepID=UPI003D0DD23E